MNKCTGIMGRIFGHIFVRQQWTDTPNGQWIEYYVCARCGAVTGEKE